MIRNFKLLGYVESLSLLVLVGICMPLKYGWGMPEAVRVGGSIHGALFVIYVIASFPVGERLGWPMKRVIESWVIASIPFGPFVLEKRLFRET